MNDIAGIQFSIISGQSEAGNTRTGTVQVGENPRISIDLPFEMKGEGRRGGAVKAECACVWPSAN